MVFSSLVFLFIFLPVTFLVYFLVPFRFKNLVLFVASLFFYAWGEPIYVSIMIFSTIFDFYNGILLEHFEGKEKIRKFILINSLVINLGILCFFKYYNFLIDNLNMLFSLHIIGHKLALPVGISFYTFQTLSYTIDVYLKQVNAQKNIISFGTYVAMFPQLVAGPIVKYKQINEDLKNRKHTIEKFSSGVELFIKGLAKKVIIANNLGNLWDITKQSDDISILMSWIGILAYTFQIYYDFSGYSDMARGLGRMFGFEIMENFKLPYSSKSVTEFWRRWHISLGQWFREYVYIPLGGNRCSKLKQLLNLFIVWFLTGFWHGASWNFIIWGLYFGFILVFEKFFIKSFLNKFTIIAKIYTFLLVVIGWVFFDTKNLNQAFNYLSKMFALDGSSLILSNDIYYIKTYFILFLLAFIFSMSKISIKEKIETNWQKNIIYIILLLLSTAYLVNETYNPFLYFRF